MRLSSGLFLTIWLCAILLISHFQWVSLALDTDFSPPPWMFPKQTMPSTLSMPLPFISAAWTALSGLAEDMLALTDIQPRECLRGEIWSPVRRAPSTRRGVCDSMASPSLQALRKLLNRLEVWRSRPWDVALRRRILASLGRIRMLLPEFPFFAAVDDRLCDVARETATLLAEQEKLARLQRWKEVTRNDPVRIRSFVKQRADMAVEWASVPPQAHSTPAGWHPAVAVQKAACDWTAQWSREALNDYASVDSILAGVSRPPACSSCLEFDAHELRKAMAVMKRKAGGADGWRPSSLLLLPTAWWQLAASLWRAVLQWCKVPSAWRHARVALIFKPNGSTRPITLLSALWRAGARCLKNRLKGWIASWRTHADAGGIPCTSVASALMQIRRAFDQGASHFVQADVAGYFDSISVPLLCQVLSHLRAPQALIDLITDFYHGACRVFCMSGVYSSHSCQIRVGIAQGCPLSPVLACALTHVWSQHVLGSSPEPSLGCLGYIDDRTLWVCDDSSLQNEFSRLHILERALQRSSFYDKVFELSLSLKKCQVIAQFPNKTTQALAAKFEFGCTDTLELLGVVAPFAGPWTLQKFSVQKAIERLRLLRWMAAEPGTHATLVGSLVAPCFAWASGFARPPPSELARVRREVLHLFGKHFHSQSAPVLVFESVGWMLEPTFACDAGTLRVLWRTCAEAPAWMDTLPLPDILFHWQQCIPEAHSVLSRLGWQLSHDGAVLLRWDLAGQQRFLQPGADSFRLVLDWLEQHYRNLLFFRTGRIRQSFHRSDPALARGLQLDAPHPSNGVHLFAGHRHLAHTQQRAIRLAASGSGGDCWFLNAHRDGPGFEPSHARWRCMCGGLHPSRTHLTWVCNATSHFSDLRVTVVRSASLRCRVLNSLQLRPAWIPRTCCLSSRKTCDAVCRFIPSFFLLAMGRKTVQWARMPSQSPLASSPMPLAMGTKISPPTSRNCVVSGSLPEPLQMRPKLTARGTGLWSLSWIASPPLLQFWATEVAAATRPW